jgi:ribosomal-protein-alanine N-acetyltransferase
MNISFGEYQVRSYLRSDSEAIAKYANNFNIFKNLKDRFPHPYTFDDAEEWLLAACNQSPEINFAIAIADELIGAIGLEFQDDVYRFSAEIGYWLAEPYWGKGITAGALRVMTKYSFENFDFNRIFANVFELNPASVKVLEKAGYTFEARLRKSVFKQGRFQDQIVYSILRDEYEQLY